MGTNYFASTPPCEAACEHCSKSEPVHICKSLISFRAYRTEYEGQEHRLGPIGSWAEWKTVLRSPAVVGVVDEYGDRYTVEGFIDAVETTEPAQRRRQHDMAQDSQYRGSGQDWLCPDGFSFYNGEFS